ncbi:bacillithiol system redox-active protein YtxJ [Litoribaculum gwangyangense]|uniref:Bacillithiol system redox-active protein YtxJ n=1 Tax=Litoribaculum gwangyangense TaxID=1130722 RepID=A0ABP9CH64_9FLAO
MGILNKLFGGSTEQREKKELPWISLSELQQLDFIEEKSTNKTQVIFKHSTRCGISSMVMNLFIDAYDYSENDIDLYYLDLISYRNISNKIAHKFQVIHESPQLLVIRNGIAVAHASHSQINDLNLQQFI